MKMSASLCIRFVYANQNKFCEEMIGFGIRSVVKNGVIAKFFVHIWEQEEYT